MNSRLVAVTAALSLASSSVYAEAYKFNLHVGPGFGLQFKPGGFITGADLKVDFAAFSIGPLAPQVQLFGMGSGDNNLLDRGGMFGAGIGLRWRILNDEGGYFINPGSSTRGNLPGNLWLDADFVVSSGGPRVGFDVALGYEISLINGVQMGPFAKFIFLRDSHLLFGVSFSTGGPDEVPADFDPDNDGIKGPSDQCPDQAEDLDGFEDADGCPEADNDKDGIDDEKDQCKGQAEDKDGFEDADGCPEADNDKDGILDEKDKCKNEPEDKDGNEDDDGCPEGGDDTDKDGILDEQDKCKTEPEDRDGFEDADGCPEIDNDKDGINDDKDQCRNEPETVNGVDDTDGCPEKEATVFITGDHIVITEQVFFDTSKATIKPESNKVLDNLANVMKKFPAIKKIRVEGHTDDVGDDTVNLKLSQKRAESVRDALVKRGIEAARLDPQGFGETKPLIKETTEEARAKNRRVEFVIVEQTK